MKFTKIDNKQGITKIILRPTLIAKCKIGQDWYVNKLDIHFIPNNCYPDYMEVNEYIMSELDGAELNIEDVVERVYNFFNDTYSPKSLKVIDNVSGVKTHFDVVVIKE